MDLQWLSLQLMLNNCVVLNGRLITNESHCTSISHKAQDLETFTLCITHRAIKSGSKGDRFSSVIRHHNSTCLLLGASHLILWQSRVFGWFCGHGVDKGSSSTINRGEIRQSPVAASTTRDAAAVTMIASDEEEGPTTKKRSKGKVWNSREWEVRKETMAICD